MNIDKTLLISFLTFLLMSPQAFGFEDCPEIKAEAIVRHSTGGIDNGEVELSIEKKEQYTLFVFGPDENRLNLKEFKVTGLKRGDYNFIVQDKKGCTKRLSIKIN